MIKKKKRTETKVEEVEKQYIQTKDKYKQSSRNWKKKKIYETPKALE